MNFKVIGEVISGNKIGRQLGFPTANVAIGDDLPVPNGVYAAEVTVPQGTYPAMVNIGTRPSAGIPQGGRVFEAHILGFEGDLYGTILAAELLEFIRAEQKFASLEELRAAISADRDSVTRFFESRRHTAAGNPGQDLTLK